MFRKCQTKLPDSRLQIVWLVVLISSARNEQLEKSNDPLGMRMKDMLISNSLNRHREKEKCALNVFWNEIALSLLYIMAEKYGKKSVHSNQWVYVCKFVVFQMFFVLVSKYLSCHSQFQSAYLLCIFMLFLFQSFATSIRI